MRNFINFSVFYMKTVRTMKTLTKESPAIKKVMENGHKSNTMSPNVLIYSNEELARKNLEVCLRKVLDCDKYTLYSVSKNTLETGAWKGKAALVAVIGKVGTLSSILLQHFLEGGRLLAFHSDLLHTVLPFFENTEVPQSILEFNFDSCKTVKVKHHILINKAKFCDRYSGHAGHDLEVKILASEDIWNTPSLLQVTDVTNGGIAVFSQMNFHNYSISDLDEGDKNVDDRLEIIYKILGDIMGLQVRDPQQSNQIDYTKGYFLGNTEKIIPLIKNWSQNENLVQNMDDITVQWCLKESLLESPSQTFLPISINENCDSFSSEEYFKNLSSRHVGRLLIYSDVLTSTMDLTKVPLVHGIGAVARRQTVGRGRGGNAWISPPGQAAVSIQIWQKMSPLLPLIQHASALAVTLALRKPPYNDLDIRIKWPNDIYYGREVKIGGVITTANCIGEDVIINVGTGVNISNSTPTICVNDIILDYNKKHLANLPTIKIESFIGKYCSEFEKILDGITTGDGIESFLDQYYEYWLHKNEEITVQTIGQPSPVSGIISGVDSAGWLQVRTLQGEITVTPDGNTFDIMSGLIAPKC